ncbi:hypothetical protein [Lactococcus lactis]|uniref:Repressor n=1 Tax=Lactococcus lactis TaxID=1358 RepID=A0AB35KAD4_9LACT|nr:hypothetical protein [Lactococcus lactis]MDG4978448.1 hypothetical protein [Lactococcus lactis]MDG5048207.1 hypothetical protein [Lactococcus lactis]
MEIDKYQAKAIRRKQADLRLTAKAASLEIGISQKTYSKIIIGGNFKNTVYDKAMKWLSKDY